MPTLETYWLLAAPILMGLLAVGAVLFIKITRRRQAMRDRAFTDAVPAKPLSQHDARRMARRYLWVAAAIVVVLVLGLLFLAIDSS